MSESTNSEAVFGSDIKRLPFKDLNELPRSKLRGIEGGLSS